MDPAKEVFSRDYLLGERKPYRLKALLSFLIFEDQNLVVGEEIVQVQRSMTINYIDHHIVGEREEFFHIHKASAIKHDDGAYLYSRTELAC